MAIQRSCDVCLRPMEGDNNTQVRVIHKTWTSGDGVDKRQAHLELKITRALNGTWNGGDVCTDCLRAAVADGEASALAAGGM